MGIRMSGPIVHIDRSEIVDGKLEELKEGIDQLVQFVDAHEPQLLSYSFYINEAARQMTVIAVHPDSASLEFHMETARPEFRKLAGLIKLLSIEAYGRPSDKALKQLLQKTQMLGEDGHVLVQEPQAGFARFPS
jgi:quinol monooxygenase YgiN